MVRIGTWGQQPAHKLMNETRGVTVELAACCLRVLTRTILRQDANARSLELLKFTNLKLWSHIFKFLYITQLSYYESFTIQVLPLFEENPNLVVTLWRAAAHTHNSMDSPKADRKMVCVCRTSTLHTPRWCILPRIKVMKVAVTSFQASPHHALRSPPILSPAQ